MKDVFPEIYEGGRRGRSALVIPTLTFDALRINLKKNSSYEKKFIIRARRPGCCGCRGYGGFVRCAAFLEVPMFGAFSGCRGSER